MTTSTVWMNRKDQCFSDLTELWLLSLETNILKSDSSVLMYDALGVMIINKHVGCENGLHPQLFHHLPENWTYCQKLSIEEAQMAGHYISKFGFILPLEATAQNSSQTEIGCKRSNLLVKCKESRSRRQAFGQEVNCWDGMTTWSFVAKYTFNLTSVCEVCKIRAYVFLWITIVSIGKC